MEMHILAMLDMRGNFVGIGLVLLIGGVVLRFARSKKKCVCWWLPVAAFVAGPLWAIGWFLADLCSPNSEGYVSYAEFIETFVPVVTVGVIGGVLGAVALAIICYVPFPRIHNSRTGQDKNAAP